MSSEEIRKKFLEFFEKKGHTVIPSSSLVPEKDVTTLFTGSGMQPLLPYLLGKEHPLGKRLTNSQKCFRAEDIDEVGDNRHTTFFEMLGNWSLGEYFKEEQLPWFFEFLTDEVGLPAERLYVTVFAGDEKNGIPRDTESVEIWKKLFAGKKIDAKDIELLTLERGGELGMQGGRIFYYDSRKNWWSRAGTPDKMPAREPGGPDSEVFYEFEDIPHDEKFGKNCHPNCDCGRFMEIGNSVFMEYVKKEDGGFEKLKQRNVDFGGGLERIAAASNNDADIFNIDVFGKAKEEIAVLCGVRYEENGAPNNGIVVIGKNNSKGMGADDMRFAYRVILDHLRAAIFLTSDGVLPSKDESGYLVRRLLRRSVRFSIILEIPQGNLARIARIFTEEYAENYPNVKDRHEEICAVIDKEEKEFRKVLVREGPRLENAIQEAIFNGILSAEIAFQFATTHGFPIELIVENANERGVRVDVEGFKNLMKKHQEISRAGQEKKFGGHGLILNTGELKAANEEELKKVTRLHTATHMLQQALREVLGPEVKQMGSDITVERTRFDFAFSRKLTSEEIKAVEDKVNAKIKEDLPMQKVILSKAEAEKTGALFFFKEKYPDPVNVYFIGNNLESAWSKEFCGGPHVTHTGEIGTFKIIKEEAVGSGLRRIRGAVEP